MAKRKVTILMGAGASIEFLQRDKNGKPLTTPYLASLLTPDRATDFFNRHDALADDLKMTNWKLTDAQKKLFLECVNYCDDNGLKNFEQIIHHIDMVVDVSLDLISIKRAPANVSESSLFHLVNFFLKLKSDDQTIERLPFDVRHYLLQYIAEHHSPLKEAYSVWCDFFLKIKNDGCSISIFNLNYDRLMMEVAEKSGQNGICLDTGFNLASKQSGFDASAFYEAENILAQLHGSVHFVPFSESSVTTRVRYYRNLKDASAERLRYATPESTQSNSRDYNWAMVTGLSKFEYVAKEPYATYYRRLIRDLDESNIVVIIGYGGGDRHINMLLKSPLIKGKHLLVVDKKKEDWIGQRVVDHFGQKLSTFLHNEFFKNDATISDEVDLSKNEKCKLFTHGAKFFLQHGKIFL